ncbi:fluoride efflux transporter CrcB [Sporosarcina aquimarina]|uniref:fluoride efflux transporter CrcB n=1 Tax=Sporosarcina aquimarina TaxID=114975 RepID=UPI00203B75F3|nr:fluoride efflux transporter CrcB [Sporosarcina aquimarina]MCM3757678.1 fluoride efflux transporter CrcB [Sporosarcina aquimarina]
MTWVDLVAVAAGGFTGAIIRYFVSKKLNTNSLIPYGTLVVNLLGCLLIGLVVGLQLSSSLTFLLATGVAGALTTFSTWVKEIVAMARLQEFAKSVVYLLGSIIFGIAFVYVGYIGGTFF